MYAPYSVPPHGRRLLDTNGVYVNAKSYRNAHRDGKPVIFLPFYDIRSVREMRKTWTWRHTGRYEKLSGWFLQGMVLMMQAKGHSKTA